MGPVAARYLTLAILLALTGSPQVALAEGDNGGPVGLIARIAAFLGSCRTIQARRRLARELTAIPAALKDICEEARQAIPLDQEGARKFFETHFRPIRISKLGETDGFLTGYYEPIIAGSRVPTGEFTAPLYRRPPN